ncbi:MAG: cation:proton antiporter [Elusimicrobiota bacterium]
MIALDFLQDLTLVLISAAAVLLLFRRLKQPPVLGYLAVGLILGPHTPPVNLVADPHSLEALAEIGVVFLLFALGVEFNLKRLAAVGARALVCAGLEVLLLSAAGYYVGILIGMKPLGALLFGGVISLASTAITARMLLEHGGSSTGWGELASGVLIAEDIIAVVMIAFFASVGEFGSPSVATVFSMVARFGMLVTLILVAGLLVLPGVLAHIEKSGIKEVYTLVIIGTCFGVSFLTEKLGFSSALGAFLAGAMMSETATATKLRESVEPFKTVFGAVFFVAVGMMINPSWIFLHWQLALGLTTFVVLARLVVNFGALSLAGEEPGGAVQATLARLPIGEFSFILAQLGDRQGLAEWPLYPLAVLLCLGTTLFSASLLPPVAAAPARVERLLPDMLKRFLVEYRSGLKRLSVPRRARLVMDLIRPSVIQIFLNVLGLSGLFLMANAFDKRFGFDVRYPGGVWLAAAFVMLPFLLALWRKTQAVTLILLEAFTTRGADPRPPAETHPLMTRFMLSMATVVVAWWFLSMSLSILPPWPYTLFPVVLMLGGGMFLWREMNRLYSKIQVRLRETLEKGHALPEAGATVLSHLVENPSLSRVRIASFVISKHSGAAGKSIRELNLHALTGASIVQVNHCGEAFPSPGPSVRLHEGDEVLLVGTPEEISSARELLCGGDRAR